MRDRSITAALLWDKFGIGVSGICAIHCLFFPAIVSVMPLWPAASAAYEWLHPLFIAVLVPIVYFAIRRSHYDRKISGALLAGLLLVILGWLLGHFWLGIWVEIGLTLAGSFILITGHWFNYYHHRHCTNTRHNHHPIAEELESQVKGETA